MSVRKRFYKAVSVGEDATGFFIELDGRMVRSPAKSQLVVPVNGLARAIADEWDAQGEEIDPASMPLFSLAVTVVDRVMPQRSELVKEMLAYGGNDLLCYRADDDDELAAHQHEKWQPWLDWSANSLGASLQVATGIMPVRQPQAALNAFDAAIGAHDDWELGMLHRAVALGGSLVLGLAFLRREMDHAALFEAAFADELWQVQKWGSDYEAEDRRTAIQGELAEVTRFLDLLRAEAG